MKRAFITIIIFSLYIKSFSQWQLSLTMNSNETIAGISSPTNNVIWSVTNNFFIYKTINGGGKWKKVKCNELASNISIGQLYAVNDSVAFLSVDTNTGVGPGLIYKTTDGGANWKKVFTHKGTSTILIGMFDNNEGIMACSFDSFNGSIPAGQALYFTHNGGNSWIKDTSHLARSFILNLETKHYKAAITDYNHFYYSSNRGDTFPVKYHLPNASNANYYLQFEDSNYIIFNSGNLIDLVVRRPGSNGWINMHTPQGVVNGAITGIVLDGAECWFSEAFDTNQLYYSSDSARTFTATVPLQNSSFRFLIKARNGRTLIGGTPSFTSGKIYLNKRTSAQSEIPVAYIK